MIALGTQDQALFVRIGDALAQVKGKVEVVGHTDNAPIRTLRFPSNWELSKARAESVTTLLAGRVPRPRIEANGRGETEPVASNDTADGRARNRRVEIVLYVPAEGIPDAESRTPLRKPEAIARLIFNRWVLLGFGLFAGAVLIWWVGPEISIGSVRPLAAESVRWILSRPWCSSRSDGWRGSSSRPAARARH